MPMESMPQRTRAPAHRCTDRLSLPIKASALADCPAPAPPADPSGGTGRRDGCFGSGGCRVGIGMNVRRMVLAGSVMLLAFCASARSPNTFNASKKLLAAIHEDIGHMTTLYCGCLYVRKGASGGESTGRPADSKPGRTKRAPTAWSGSTSFPHRGSAATEAAGPKATNFASGGAGRRTRGATAAPSAASIRISWPPTTTRTICFPPAAR